MQERAHGMMYHHFHDGGRHIVGQGSISAETFHEELDYYGRTHNILSAEAFLWKFRQDRLSCKDVCLTFDDNLLCQFDIAYPVMQERGLTGFWFLYTSPFDGEFGKVEIYRHFRFSCFADVEEFYRAFFEAAYQADGHMEEAMRQYQPDTYLAEFPFYTPSDKRFRYMRDMVLGEAGYNGIMDDMIKAYCYDISENAKLLWMHPAQVRALHDNGHVIGLHSHTHPMVMCQKDLGGQKREYETNKARLEQMTGAKVVCAAHPCNSYNKDTLACMRSLGIEIGFRSNMAQVSMEDPALEYPREDHANILKEMRCARS